MENDIFFDCPQCNHTIKVSSELVGVEVECPDCANEFKVPDIRDGLHPRLRSQVQGKNFPGNGAYPELDDNLEGLEESLKSLLRRQNEQIQQMDLLEEAAHLLHKQVAMISPSRNAHTAPLAEPAFEHESSANGWLRWSHIFGWLTLGLTLLIGALVLRA